MSITAEEKAKVLKVIKRNTSTFIGRIYHKNKQVFVNVSTHQPKDIKLNDHDEVLEDFTVVEVCITNWNERGPTAHGELSKIISLPDNPLADHLYVVNKYLGHRFSYEKHSKIFVGDLEKMEVAINLTRITFPFLFFICLASFFSAILNSHNKFAAAAAAPIILNIVLILVLVLSKSFGDHLVYYLSYGVSLAGFLQLRFLYK